MHEISYPVASQSVSYKGKSNKQAPLHLTSTIRLPKPPASWPSLSFFTSASEAGTSKQLSSSRAHCQYQQLIRYFACSSTATGPASQAPRGPMDGCHSLMLLSIFLLSLSCQAATTTGAASIVLLPSLLNQSAIAFNGVNSSDLAQQFYQRYTRGDSVESFNSSTVAKLPTTISRRLARLNVSIAAFTQLPGLLQRAVMWDSGFVLDAKSNSVFVQVWTSQGRSMADIVVSSHEILESSAGPPQCPLTQCTQPHDSSDVTSYKTTECGCETLARVSKCAIPENAELGGDLQASSSPSLLWALGADPSAIPVPRIAEHRCQADSTNNSTSSNTIRSTTVLSIHTAHVESLVGCSSTQFDSLVIPCVRLSTLTSTLRAKMREPKPSAWVDTWLIVATPLVANREASSGSSTPSPSSSGSQDSNAHSFKIVLLIPIVMGSLVAIALVGLVAIRYTGPQHQKSDRGVTTNSSIDVSALLSPRSKDYS